MVAATLLKSNSFEGGTNTTPLTQGSGGNTGGASGDYFDVVSGGASNTCQFTSTSPLSGSMSVRWVKASTNQLIMGWTFASAQSDFAFRMSFRFPAGNFAADEPILRLYSGAAYSPQIGAVQLLSGAGRKVRASDTGTAVNVDSAASLTNSTDYTIIGRWISGTSLTVTVFVKGTATVAAIATVTASAASVNSVRIGLTGSGNSAATVIADDFAIGFGGDMDRVDFFPVTATSANTWGVRQAVTATSSQTWGVRAAVTATAAETWAVTTSITATFSHSWAVRSAVSATSAQSWAVRASVTKTAAESWVVRQAIAATSAQSWAVKTSVTASSIQAWAVRAEVTKTAAGTWNVAAQISKTAAESWSVRQQITQTAAQSWDVFAIGSVSASFGSTWAVRAQVTAATAEAWAIRTVVTKQAAESWAVRVAVLQSLEQGWAVREAITASSAQTWGVSSIVSTQLALLWAIRTLATKTLATSWDVDGAGPRRDITITTAPPSPRPWSTAATDKRWAGVSG